jgi:hypothetical protein
MIEHEWLFECLLVGIIGQEIVLFVYLLTILDMLEYDLVLQILHDDDQ